MTAILTKHTSADTLERHIRAFYASYIPQNFDTLLDIIATNTAHGSTLDGAMLNALADACPVYDRQQVREMFTITQWDAILTDLAETFELAADALEQAAENAAPERPEVYTVECIENAVAKRHGLTIKHCVIRQPDGMLMRCLDGVVWSCKSAAKARRVAQEANEYLEAHME